MRRLGYQALDLVVDTLAGLPDRPPSRRAAPEELAGLLNEPVPRAGADPEAVLRQAVEDVLGPAMRVDHPRFFAYVPISSNYVGMLADALASGFGCSPGPGRQPRARPRPSWPPCAGCGSCSACRRRPAAVLPRRHLGHDQHRQRRPLADLAGLCRAEGLWFHVDGAFGAPALLSAGGRQLLAGIEQADSSPSTPTGGCSSRWRPAACSSATWTCRLRRRPAAPPPWLGGGRPDPARLVSFCFADGTRTAEELEAVNRRVADAMLVDELATLSSTVLGGRTGLRLCTVNPRTTRADVEATLARVEELARSG